MAQSLGIDYHRGTWKICLTENSKVLECSSFTAVQATCTYITQTCALYPELLIAVSSPLAIPMSALSTPIDPSLSPTATRHFSELFEFLIVLERLHLKSWHLPAISYLPSVPSYRQLVHSPMGAADQLCAAATLFYRMRLREAPWPEMNFFFLEPGHTSYRIAVVKEGTIIDSLVRAPLALALPASHLHPSDDASQLIEQAFWEGLTQDLAGLLAIHHLEDVVILESQMPSTLKETIIERLGDTYQFFLFPDDSAESDGFEVAHGAALLVEGLYQPGLSAEVAQHLLPPMAQS